MHLRVTTLTAILAGALVAAASAQSGETLPAPHVRFGVHVVARTPSYTRIAPDTALIFEGDAVGIEISLVNKTGDVLRLGAPGRWWVGDIRLSLVAFEAADRPQAVAVSFETVFDDRAPVVAMPRDGMTSVELRVLTEKPLPPGRYRLTVTLGDELERYARGGQAPATRELNLEIRQAVTLEERLDDYLQQAFFASRRERFDEAEMWASRAFAAHPFSVVALADAAHAWRFHGRCTEGVPMLRRAIGLMNLGGDPLLVHPLPDSYRDALQAAAARCEQETR